MCSNLRIITGFPRIVIYEFTKASWFMVPRKRQRTFFWKGFGTSTSTEASEELVMLSTHRPNIMQKYLTTSTSANAVRNPQLPQHRLEP